MLNSPLLNALGTRARKFALSLGLPVEGTDQINDFRTVLRRRNDRGMRDQSIESSEHANIGTILDYSVEGKVDRGRISTTPRTRSSERSSVPRMTRTFRSRFSRLPGSRRSERSKDSAQKESSTRKSQAKCERIHTRVHEICEYAYSLGQPVFIDAEESWIQDAIDRLATEMMEQYNREQPIVFNTIQLYRRTGCNFLKNRGDRRKQTVIFSASNWSVVPIWKRNASGRQKWVTIRRSTTTRQRPTRITMPRSITA